MKGFRKIVFYFGMIGLFSLVSILVIHYGKSLETGRMVLSEAGPDTWPGIFATIESNLKHPLTILLGQIVVIILVTRVFGWLCQKIRQPVVIGEIIAGITLGPSLLGYYFPGFSETLFPAASLGNLSLLSQIGLILFMFMVGMELDFNLIKKKVTDAILISHTGIVFSFALGLSLACFLYMNYVPEGISFLSFSLFTGISLSITAFPVLARIIQESGMHKTTLGKFVVTCAAVDDITAWSLLAVVIAVVKAGSMVSALPTILLSLAYVFLMLKVVQPFLTRLGELHTTRENLTKPVVAVFFLILMLSAYATEAIGIHAIFGGFMAGVIMPDNLKFRNIFIEKVEDVALVLFLPLFFVYTGLRTQIGLLNDWEDWKICLIIIVVAITGKFAGATISARFAGHKWSESLSIGTLMNSRGLVELVVLNIGFDLGVFSPKLFAMLVIMALVTTFMTAPALQLIQRIFSYEKEESAEEERIPSRFRILLSFGNPERGKSLLRLANCFIRLMHDKASVTAMHLSPGSDLFPSSVDDYEKESFLPIIEESQNLNREFTTLFKISSDIESDITEVANKGEFDLLLIGVGQSLYDGSLLGKVLGFTSRIINPAKLFYRVTGKERSLYTSVFDERTRLILSKTDVPTGIFIDRDFTCADHVFVFVANKEDHFLLPYVNKLADNSGSVITIFDPSGSLKNNHLKSPELTFYLNQGNHRFIVLEKEEIESELLNKTDLMLITTTTWAELIGSQPDWLYNTPSTLILSA